MFLVATIDFISFLAVIAALIALVRGWNQAPPYDTKVLVLGLLGLALFHHFSNILEWGGISKVLDPFEDFLELLIPMLWFGLFYSYLKVLATENLRKSEKKLKEAQEIAQIGQWELDLASNSLYCSDGIYFLFEIGPEKFEGSYDTFIEAVHPDDRGFVDKSYTESVKNKTQCNITHRLLFKNGTLKYVNTICRTEYDENGRPVCSVGTIQDITERKQAEEALQESEERYRSLFKNNHSIMLLIDAENADIVDANPAAVSYYGWSYKELTQKKITDINTLTKENIFQEMDQAKKEQRQHFFFRHRLSTGEIRDVEVYSGPITVNKKKLLYSIIHDITERKQAEEAMRESEEKFRTMMNAMKDPVYICSPDYRVEYMNPAMIKRTGYDATGDKCFQALHNLDDKCPWCMHHRSQEKKCFESEIISPKDNHTYMVTHSPIVHTDGSISTMTVFRDVTRHTQMQLALKEASTIINRSPAVTFLWKNAKEWPVEFVSENVKELFGYTCEDFTSGKVFYSTIVHPDDLERVKAEVSIFINEKGKDGFIHKPYRIITKQGAIKWLDDRTFIRKNKKGDITHYEGIVIDITKAKIIAEKRELAEQALRIEHDKLQSVLNGIGEGMYIVDKDFNIEFQNNIFIGDFGDCNGKKCYKSVFKLDKPCKDCLITETLRTNSVQQRETSFLGGKYYDMSFSPLKEPKGTNKVIILIKDITEKKNFQAEAMRANHLAALGELAAGVAHEINNPITGIISLAEIVSDQLNETGKDIELPNRIIKEGERIGKIVKSLLSFARDRKEEHSLIHISHILNETLALTEKQISKDGIYFSIDIAPGIPKIKARSYEIQQVFLNIISNARYALNQKFPGPHSDKVFKIIGQSIDVNGEMYVRIIFFDKGIGIPENILEKIRDPFFSTKPQGEGTGLGLSISDGIINSHGGKLWFESQENQYTKVMVDLPVSNG